MIRLERFTRLLIAVLATAQSALPAAAALADPPSLPAEDHRPHIAADGEAGCGPYHSEHHCLLCRALSTPLPEAAAPVAGAPGESAAMAAPRETALPVQAGLCSETRARPPPGS